MFTVSLRPTTLFRALVAAAVVLVLLSVISDVLFLTWERAGRAFQAFDVNRESNVPTWWSSFQVGLLALLCLHLARRDRTRPGGRPLAWLLCGAVLLCVSVDEVAQLHEQLSAVFHDLTGRSDGVFRYGWVFLVLPVVIAFVLAVSPLLLSLPRPVAGELVAGGAVFLLGAVVLEMVGSSLVSAGWSRTSFPYVLEYTFEEFFEMLGVAIAFHTVARWAARPTGVTVDAPGVENARTTT